jgi:hypothetical protein
MNGGFFSRIIFAFFARAGSQIFIIVFGSTSWWETTLDHRESLFPGLLPRHLPDSGDGLIP